MTAVDSLPTLVADFDKFANAAAEAGSGVPASVIAIINEAREFLDPLASFQTPNNAAAIASDIATLMQDAEKAGDVTLPAGVLDTINFFTEYPTLIANLKSGQPVQMPVGFSIEGVACHAYVIADTNEPSTVAQAPAAAPAPAETTTASEAKAPAPEAPAAPTPSSAAGEEAAAVAPTEVPPTVATTDAAPATDADAPVETEVATETELGGG
jgi:hypothetical protein